MGNYGRNASLLNTKSNTVCRMDFTAIGRSVYAVRISWADYTQKRLLLVLA